MNRFSAILERPNKRLLRDTDYRTTRRHVLRAVRVMNPFERAVGQLQGGDGLVAEEIDR
jgi:hypothetical protein